MSDREKMIEVIRYWSNGAFSPVYAGGLADRLIEAGFGVMKKETDFTNIKITQPKELLDMVRVGNRPILVCNKTVEDLGIDSPWELGMYARVKSIAPSTMGDDGLEVTLDLSEFSEINDGMAGHDWYMKGGRGLGTCKEAGWWKPEDTIWVPYDGFEMEMVE